MEETMVCPQCHSDNIQKYEVAFLNGTSVSSSTTVGAGLASNLGVGAAKTTTTTQNTMAAITAPPAKKGYVKSFFLYVVIGIIVSMIASSLSNTLGTVLFYVSFVFAGYMVYKKNYLWNQNEWPKLMEQWNHSYVCLKCGHHFLL